MQIVKHDVLLEAFQLPLLGRIADETPPPWLVTRLQSGELSINQFGGLTQDVEGLKFIESMAGDIVVLTPDGSIEFEPMNTQATVRKLEI